MSTDNQEKTFRKKACLACGLEFANSLMICPHDGILLVELSNRDLVGTTLADRYQILSIVGQGGMGVVYKANHLQLERAVAVKVLHQHLVSDPYTLKRFQREAKASSLLSHPNVIAVHDFGVTAQGQPYLVQDYLEGTSLSEILEKEKHISVLRGKDIFGQACDGLAHAHHRGVVHRDLKPSNIMLIKTEELAELVKIVDFGIAKLLPQSGKQTQQLTQVGETFGSPMYMSPEQCLAHELDPRSDVYSLGCVMYEALTGRPPFKGDSIFETMEKHVSEVPPPMSTLRLDLRYYSRLERVILKAMSKEAGDRQQSMTELKSEMLAAIEGGARRPVSSVVNQAAKSETAARRWLRLPKPVAVMILLVGLLALLMVLLAKQPDETANSSSSKSWKAQEQAAQMAIKKGNQAQAEKALLSSIKIAEGFPSPDIRLATSLDHLADLYLQQGKLADSEKAVSRALAIKTSLLGPDPETAASLIMLGRISLSRGQLLEASRLYGQSLAILRKTLSSADPRVLAVAREYETVKNRLKGGSNQ